jgi:hypothetical protein
LLLIASPCINYGDKFFWLRGGSSVAVTDKAVAPGAEEAVTTGELCP